MYKTKTITKENQWTTPIKLIGKFNYSAQGIFDAKVTLQRSFDDGSNWEDLDFNIDPFSLTGEEPRVPFKFSKPTVYYRLGVKTGEFTSGTISVRLGIR